MLISSIWDRLTERLANEIKTLQMEEKFNHHTLRDFLGVKLYQPAIMLSFPTTWREIESSQGTVVN